VTALPWLVMSPDLNPLKHACHTLGRRLQAVDPHVQNLRREW